MTKIVKAERVSLKNSSEFTEKVIQDYIFQNPAILGLGDLTPIQKERIQPLGGRIDLLLVDDSNSRYELELQLGATDPSHIIRTIEYWDTERKRYPQYDHCAVIVAEEITGRFLNVISLFNGTIPLIALQVSAFKVGETEISLVFTKVMDRLTYGTDEEEIFESTDRKYWEKKATAKSLTLMDNIFKEIPDVANRFSLKYNKFYIGLLSQDGIAKNFITFTPKKLFLYLEISCSLSDEVNAKFEKNGLEFSYSNRLKLYSIKIYELSDYMNNKENIDNLIDQAKANFNL